MSNLLSIWNKQVQGNIDNEVNLASYYTNSDEIDSKKNGKSTISKHLAYGLDGEKIIDVLKNKIQFLLKEEKNAETKLYEDFFSRIRNGDSKNSDFIASLKEALKSSSDGGFTTDKDKIAFFNFVLGGESSFYNEVVETITQPNKDISQKEKLDKDNNDDGMIISTPKKTAPFNFDLLKQEVKGKKTFYDTFAQLLNMISNGSQIDNKDFLDKLDDYRKQLKLYSVSKNSDLLQKIAFQPKGKYFITLWNFLSNSELNFKDNLPSLFESVDKKVAISKDSVFTGIKDGEVKDYCWADAFVYINATRIKIRVLKQVIERSSGANVSYIYRNQINKQFINDILVSSVPNAINKAKLLTLQKRLDVSDISITSNANLPQIVEKITKGLTENEEFWDFFDDAFSKEVDRLFNAYSAAIKGDGEIEKIRRKAIDKTKEIVKKYLSGGGSTNYKSFLKQIYPAYESTDSSAMYDVIKSSKGTKKLLETVGSIGSGQKVLESLKNSLGIMVKEDENVFSISKGAATSGGLALENLTNFVLEKVAKELKKVNVQVQTSVSGKANPKADINAYITFLDAQDEKPIHPLKDYTAKAKQTKSNIDKEIDLFLKELNLADSESGLNKDEQDWMLRSVRTTNMITLKKALQDIGGTMIFISDKLYRLDSPSFSGFGAEEPNLYGLGTMLKIYDRIGNSVLGVQNIDRLIRNIMNSMTQLQLSIPNQTGSNIIKLQETTQVTQEDRNIIIYSIAAFLFDDILIQNYNEAGTNLNSNLNRVHMFYLNGVYYPFSVFLQGLLRAADNTKKNLGWTNLTIPSTLSGSNQTTILKYEVGAEKDGVKNTIEALTENIKTHTKISLHFLHNFRQELKRIIENSMESN